jgi:hypothetical protein
MASYLNAIGRGYAIRVLANNIVRGLNTLRIAAVTVTVERLQAVSDHSFGGTKHLGDKNEVRAHD